VTFRESRKISVVIVNWNGWKDTVECLESSYGLGYPDYRIVVVDNGSTDGSIEYICAGANGNEQLDLDCTGGNDVARDPMDRGLVVRTVTDARDAAVRVPCLIWNEWGMSLTREELL
jgi:GT2 family glycosyltransferase